MRSVSAFLLSTFLFCIPTFAIDGELIFPQQGKHVHGSSIVECPNGDLLATWFHGSGERSSNDVMIQGARLKKGASEWSPVYEFADTPNLPDCNPVLHIDNDDKLWLLWIVVQGNRWEQSILKYRTSTDYQGEGAPNWDWQDIILLKPGEEFVTAMDKGFKELGFDEDMWAEYAYPYDKLIVDAAKDRVKRDTGWMTRCNLVTLEDGRILIPLYSDGYNTSLMAISDDGGKSWQCSAPIVGLGNIQPTVCVKKDGGLVAYMRDNGRAPKRIIEAFSNDNGQTWTVGTDMDLPNSGASVAAVTLANGDWVLVYNDTEQGRHSLVASISKNEGKTWKGELVLDRSKPGEGNFGYPCVIQGADGTIHVSYSYKGSSVGPGASIKHMAFQAKEIR